MAKSGNSSNNLFRDGSHEAVQVGGSFQTSDATASPNKSPLTVSSSVITLIVPDNAVRFVGYSVTNDTRVSPESTAADNYFVIKAGATVSFDCARMANIYLLRDAGADATFDFYFTIV